MMGSPAPQDNRRQGAGLAEAVGTFAVVLVSAGAVCVDQAGVRPLGRVGVALASGLVLCVAGFALRPLSGAHLNPAVSFAGLLVGRLSPRAAATYMLAQLIGAAAAGVTLRVLIPAAQVGIHLGLPLRAPGMSLEVAIAAEAAVGLAWVLAFALTSWREPRSHLGPLVLGFINALGVLVLGPLGSAAGNPARAFGPAFASGLYLDHGVFWLGPLFGACAASVAHAIVAWRHRGTKHEASVPEPLDPVDREAQDGVRAPPPSEASNALPSADRLSLPPDHYRQGLALYREGRLEEAANELALATELHPEWPEPYYYIGIVYRDLGDDANANAFFETALYLRFEHGTQEPCGKRED